MDVRRSWRELTSQTVYIGPRTTQVVAVLVLLVGLVAAVGGVAYAVDGARQAPQSVTVPVAIQPPGWPEDGLTGPVAVRVDGVDLPASTRLETVDQGLVLVDADGTDRWTGFLARADVALGGLAVGVCALLLAPVLLSIACGEPFRRRNAARIGWTATTVAAAGFLAPVLPQVAGALVLERRGLAQPDDPFVVFMTFDPAPLGVAALLFVVAEAFRRGTQIADDTAGLV